MSECAQGADHCCMHYLELLVLKLEVALEQFIDSEIGCMGRDTTTGNHLSTLPEPQKPFLLVEDSGCLKET
jgi:hypothetical protein